jgi:hypothetical protein
MPDHIHDSVRAKKKDCLEKFKRETNGRFSRLWNENARLNGPVFESPFGSALKFGDKQVRTNLIYVGNNAVERRLVVRAEEYRWNYLAYAVSSNPFSKPLVIRKARLPLRKAVKEVRMIYDLGRPVNYAILKRLFEPLEYTERLQLTDFIISTYNVIDYTAAINCFNNYGDMLAAMHATTGSEYDIRESHVGKSDACYNKMTAILLDRYHITDIHEILTLSLEDKFNLFVFLQGKTGAETEQIAKFLHLPLNIMR